MTKGTYKRTEKTKNKNSMSMMGNIPWNKNGIHSEKTKRKMSELKLGKNHPNYGNKYNGKRLQQMISSGNKGRFKHHKINKSFGIKKIYYEMIYFIKTKFKLW